MLHAQTHPGIRQLIEQREWNTLREVLADLPPPDIADLLHDLEKRERVLLFRALPRDQAAEVFTHLDADEHRQLIHDLTDEETRRLLADLHPDDRTALLEELPENVTEQLMTLLSPEDLREARFLLGYPEESVGRLMTPDYVAVRKHWTIEQALRHVRRRGKLAETVNRIFVVDEDWKLVDDIELRRLILGELDDTVESVMDHTYAAVQATEDREEAVRTIQRYDQSVLPVVDAEGVLVGIVTVDDLMDVAEGEFTEDMYRLAGITWSEEEEGRSVRILEANLPQVLRLRMPWLLVALAGGLMAGMVVGQFEETLEAIVFLAFFIPVIMDMGGNVGTQASTIFVRGFALGHIRESEVWRFVAREGRTGFTIGVLVGSVAGLAAWAWQGIFELGLVIFISMTITCTVASLIGFAIPWLAHKAGKDPAAVSDPFITTIKDMTGLLVYFSLATWLLAGML
jgi:magnesium transporter